MAMHSWRTLPTPSVWHPGDAAEACRLKQSLGAHAVFVSGGTLLRTQWEANMADMPPNLIDLGSVAEAADISFAASEARIGALTPLTVIRRHSAIARQFPILTEAVRLIASPSVRNMATIGGNIASAIGDSIPALLVYEADLQWHDGHGITPVDLREWMADTSPYGAESCRLLTQIRLPMRTSANRIAAFHKVGRRESFTPSLVTIALAADVDEQGVLSAVRIAAGGGQTAAHRLTAAESLLEGAPADISLLRFLHEAVMEEYRPAGDIFAGERYRKQTAANLIAAELWKHCAGSDRKEGAPCFSIDVQAESGGE